MGWEHRARVDTSLSHLFLQQRAENPSPKQVEEESLAGCTPAAHGAQCWAVRVFWCMSTHHLLVLPA